MAANPNAGTQMYYIRKSDGQTYCFSPVPLISDSKSYLRTIKDGVDTTLGITHTVTFNGTLLPELPALSGVDPDATCLELLDRKSDQLCAALDEERGNLLIVDATGYPVLSEFPRILSIDFPESQMVVQRPYTIVFEYDSIFEDDCRISNYSETWNFDSQEDDTVSVGHSVSAVGIADVTAGTGALQNAKNFVLARANVLDKTQSSFLKAPFVTSIVDIDNLSEYNHVRSETSDVTVGSYEISESWILASGAFKDDRTIDRAYELITRTPGEPEELVETITINGTILGYGDTTIDRLNNALNGFNNTVAPEIGFYAASGISAKTMSENRFAGQVNYSLTIVPDDTDPLQNRSISRSFTRNEDGSVTQSVTTSAGLRPGSASGIEAVIDYCYANNYPLDSFVEPIFDASTSGNIESVNSQRDEINRTFSLTRAFRDQETSLYREEYQVSRESNVENAITTISINGSVFGLGEETSTKSNVRFNSASGAYFNTVEPLIRSRVLQVAPSGTCVGAEPVSSTLGYNILGGAITYNQTFDNRFLTDNPSIYSEQVDVTYTLQSDVVAEIAIPAKPTGPILQDQETVTGLQKQLRIQYIMAPSGQDCGVVSALEQRTLELEALGESNVLVNNTMSDHERGEKPTATRVFKTADQYSFNRQNYTFTRSVTWKYTAI